MAEVRAGADGGTDGGWLTSEQEGSRERVAVGLADQRLRPGWWWEMQRPQGKAESRPKRPDS